jgi:hypothetical protein
LRVRRVRTGRYPADRRPNPVEVIRKIGGHWPNYQVAVAKNRMRCKPTDGKAWTTMRVRELRERLGIASFDPPHRRRKPSASIKQLCAWESASAPSTSLSVKACFLPHSFFLRRHGRFRLPHLKPGVRQVIARRPEITKFCKMIRR